MVKSQNHVRSKEMDYYRQDMSANGRNALGHRLRL